MPQVFLMGDKYKSYEKNRDKWLMGDDCKGDITDPKQIDFIEQKFLRLQPEGCDLYTADSGMDATSDYKSQEIMNADLHLGQMICGLKTLLMLITHLSQYQHSYMHTLHEHNLPSECRVPSS